MAVHRIAPLVVGLILAPCALAQTAQQPSPTTRNGHWYLTASAAAVEDAEFTYDGSDIPDLIDINYTDTTDAGAAVEAGLGYAFSNGLRTEAAIAVQNFGGVTTRQTLVIFGGTPDIIKTELSGDRIRSAALSLNAYYDFPVAGSIRPYVGGGAGIATVDVVDAIINGDDTGLSLQLVGGFNVKLSKSLSLYAEGRWQKLTDVAIRGFDLSTSIPISANIDFSTLSVRSGLRLSF